MRIAIIIVRVLLGSLMLFASISYFFKLGEQPAPTGDMATVMAGFMASKYIFPLVKVIELLSGISLVSGKFMRAFLLILLPISVNIFLLHVVVTKSDLPVACFVLIANLFLIYGNWSSYKHLFEWK